MKKILYIFLFIGLSAQAQNKTIQFGQYFVQIDTSTNLFESYPTGYNTYNYSLFVNSGYVRLFDCYGGKIFAFTDTLRSANVSQVGTTGRYRITPNASPLNTTKRNILVGNTVIQYDTNLHDTNIENKELPIIITSKATGKVICKITDTVIEYNGTAPTP